MSNVNPEQVNPKKLNNVQEEVNDEQEKNCEKLLAYIRGKLSNMESSENSPYLRLSKEETDTIGITLDDELFSRAMEEISQDKELKFNFGRVEAISLYDQNITELPKELKSFDNIRNIYLDSKVEKEMMKDTKSREVLLNVVFNNIREQIQEQTDAKGLDNKIDLSEVELGFSFGHELLSELIKSIPKKHLQKIESIDLSDQPNITELPEILKECTKLKYIKLAPGVKEEMMKDTKSREVLLNVALNNIREQIQEQTDAKELSDKKIDLSEVRLGFPFGHELLSELIKTNPNALNGIRQVKLSSQVNKEEIKEELQDLLSKQGIEIDQNIKNY